MSVLPLEETADYQVHVLGNAVLVLWKRAMTVAALQQVQRYMTIGDRLARGIGLGIVQLSSEPVKPETRRFALSRMVEWAPHVHALLMVQGGDDFWSRMTRMGMRTMLAGAGMRHGGPKHVHLTSSLEEGLDWLDDALQRTAPELEPGALSKLGADIVLGLMRSAPASPAN